MGLDMYLIGKKYVSQYSDEVFHTKLNALAKEMGIDYPINEIQFELGYWRKCNQIHNWFVENVQDGTDDCGTYYVQQENLIALYNVCKEVLEDHSKAEELLPTQSGFFFGGTEYDEYYFQDLERTIKILEPLLKEQDFPIYYNSSW